jgi:hypothetical protein
MCAYRKAAKKGMQDLAKSLKKKNHKVLGSALNVLSESLDDEEKLADLMKLDEDALTEAAQDIADVCLAVLLRHPCLVHALFVTVC